MNNVFHDILFFILFLFKELYGTIFYVIKVQSLSALKRYVLSSSGSLQGYETSLPAQGTLNGSLNTLFEKLNDYKVIKTGSLF